jgi:hypothetical protein
VKRASIAATLALAASLLAVASATAAPAQPCGLFKPCAPPDFAPVRGETYSGSTYELTLNADRTRPRAGQQVTFTGGVTRDGAPIEAGQFELVASRFPYGSEEVLASTGPTTDSTFTFTHVPQLNTRYFVRTGDLDPGDQSFSMASSLLQVRVFARLKGLKVSVPADGFVKMSVAADFPDGLTESLGKRKMRWYIIRGKGDGQRVTKIAVTRTTSSGSAKVAKASVIAELPPGRYKFRATFCFSLGVDTDVGVGDPQARCP